MEEAAVGAVILVSAVIKAGVVQVEASGTCKMMPSALHHRPILLKTRRGREEVKLRTRTYVNRLRAEASPEHNRLIAQNCCTKCNMQDREREGNRASNVFFIECVLHGMCSL